MLCPWCTCSPALVNVRCLQVTARGRHGAAPAESAKQALQTIADKAQQATAKVQQATSEVVEAN